MKTTISYSDLILLNNNILDNVNQLIEHGADQIELMMDAEKWNDMELLFEPLAKELNKFPIQYSIHPPAWDINLTSENKEIRNASFNEYKKAIEFAGMIKARHVVIHPGFCYSPIFKKETAKQRAHDSINRLCEIAEPLNVRLAVENVGYHGTSLYTQDEFVVSLQDTAETAGYLIDVGHAHLNRWDVSEVIHAVKDRLIGLHLHDNGGLSDDHLPITEGKINWEKIIRTINDDQIQCDFILEYAPATSLEKLKAGKDILSQKVFSC